MLYIDIMYKNIIKRKKSVIAALATKIDGFYLAGGTALSYNQYFTRKGWEQKGYC